MASASIQPDGWRLLWGRYSVYGSHRQNSHLLQNKERKCNPHKYPSPSLHGGKHVSEILEEHI